MRCHYYRLIDGIGEIEIITTLPNGRVLMRVMYVEGSRRRTPAGTLLLPVEVARRVALALTTPELYGGGIYVTDDAGGTPRIVVEPDRPLSPDTTLVSEHGEITTVNALMRDAPRTEPVKSVPEPPTRNDLLTLLLGRTVALAQRAATITSDALDLRRDVEAMIRREPCPHVERGRCPSCLV